VVLGRLSCFGLEMNKINRSLNMLHEKRKEEHLMLALREEVQFRDVTTGLENFAFVHRALPEINLKDIDLSTRLFNKRLDAPLIISSMVGGIEAAVRINHNLARAAQSLGLAMVVGSQRCLIEKGGLAATFQVRDVAPDILLFANLGAVQFNYGFGVAECHQIVRSIDADALVLHLNPLQEALQRAGNRDFSNLLEKIEIVCRELGVPVIVKEVGSGISEEVAGILARAGVSGIDVSGAGGTCWSEIERMRSGNRLAANVARAFAGWGIPTAESVIMARRGAPHLPIIASGGIRNGIDVAKAIALGADAAGIATPLLKAAMSSSEAVEQSLREMIEVLRIAMFCTGAADIPRLQYSPNLKKL